ncbi:UNVERIFIED_CONTAM: hypothetical protein NCL1_20528 [Trichonephila clavipes]
MTARRNVVAETNISKVVNSSLEVANSIIQRNSNVRFHILHESHSVFGYPNGAQSQLIRINDFLLYIRARYSFMRLITSLITNNRYLDQSVEGYVYLKRTDLNTEGVYRCEVSAEAPSFQTVREEKEVRVYVVT